LAFGDVTSSVPSVLSFGARVARIGKADSRDKRTCDVSSSAGRLRSNAVTVQVSKG